ncbi:flavodoxin family protein [Thioclava sp. FR2]|uniref:flavodoxin family protein n=1 Tax=Thioclava sp. FR2 TaxID=3445780 RepID=UPI003EB82D37
MTGVHDREMMRNFLFLLSSGRRNGNSECLARRAAIEGSDQTWVDLSDLSLPAFRDRRPYAPQEDAVIMGLFSDLCRATDIVFVAPVYWYALPAPAKLLIDHWSGFLDSPDLSFKDRIAGKRLWLISTRADPNPAVPSAMEAMLRQSGGWLGMAWGGALHGVGDAPGDIKNCTSWMIAPGFLAQNR